MKQTFKVRSSLHSEGQPLVQLVGSGRSPVRVLLAAVLSVLLLVPVPAVVAQASVTEAQLPLVVEASVSAESSSETLEVLRQAYDVLMDRFVHEPNPAMLLTAAWEGIVREMLGAGMPLKETPVPALEPNRDRAWSVFREQMARLLAETNPPPDLNLKAAAITSMARALKEAHTGYMSPRDYRDFLNYMRGDASYEGIGVRPRRPGQTVGEVFPNSPAEKAGIQVGDMIIAVNGDSTEGKTLEEVASTIRGPAGTAVELTIYRPRTGETLVIRIVRAPVKIEFLKTDILQGDIAYIRLQGFPEPTVAERIEQFVGQLPQLGARALVFDVRGNPGGRVDVGARILNRFISSGPLFQQVDRSGNQRVVMALGPGWARPLPTVVLIDGSTASMGEIFAAAMRERGVARLVGKQTAGSVAAALVFGLNDGSAVKVTILEINSGNGVVLNGVGVAPDDEMESSPEDLDAGRDVPLEHAIIYLRERLAAGR